MFSKLFKDSSVKNILVITLSNIGDVVLSAPVIDILLRDFSSAKISLVIGERAASLFEGNSRISRIHIFDKNRGFFDQGRWTFDLRQYHYDLVVDLRNSIIGYCLTPQWVTPPLVFPDKTIHLKDQHLNRLKSLYDFGSPQVNSSIITPSKNDELLIDELINPFLKGDPFVFIAPYAADLTKTWDSKNFAGLCQEIGDRYQLKIIMIGSPPQRQGIENIIKEAGVPILNLAGRTNLIQIAALIKRSKIAIVHDSGPMHIASYYNKPVVCLFGPTDPKCSSPWSSLYKVVHRNERCNRCFNPKSKDIAHTCMDAISQLDVLSAFSEIYARV